MSNKGIRIKERMAGWIHLNQSLTKYPFEINICAFCKIINYPFPFHFEGSTYLPGFPLPLEKNESALRPKTSGEMQISHRGVAYDFKFELPGVGEVRIKGEKKYIYTLNWKVFRESLVKLPFLVFQNDKVIGDGHLYYLPPLYQFIFGVNFASDHTAFEPRIKFYESLLSLIPVISPIQARKIPSSESLSIIKKQIQSFSTLNFLVLNMSFLFLKIFCFLRFLKTIKNLNAKDRENLAQILSKNSFIHLISFPICTIVATSVYASPTFLNQTDQNQPTKILRDEKEKWRELNLTPTSGNHNEFEVDVVIVGSGAGGAAAAYELARLGWAVAVVEEGHYFKRSDMTGDRVEMVNKLYRNNGLDVAISNGPIWMPTGKCVGGTTTINSGTVMRTPNHILSKWEQEFGLSASEMRKYFADVETMLHSKAVPCELQGGIKKVLEKGAPFQRLSPHALNRADNGCDGQACCVLGCPTDAKMSTNVSYMKAAMECHAHLFSQYRVDEIMMENGHAVGVKARLENYGDFFTLTIKAKRVVLACGTLQTPILLKKLKLKNKNIGKHLSIHPALVVGGIFPSVVREKNFVPQSMGISMKESNPFMLEGYTLPIDVIPVAFSCYGNELEEIMGNVKHFTNFASMNTDPVKGRLIFTRPGKAIPLYPIGKKLKESLNESAMVLGNIFFDAGAIRTYFPISGFERVTEKKQLIKLKNNHRPAFKYTLSAYHPLGTCRMGKSTEESVVNKFGEVWGVKDLFIVDGSAIPGPIGANPQLTIMANSLRIANYINETLK